MGQDKTLESRPAWTLPPSEKQFWFFTEEDDQGCVCRGETAEATLAQAMKDGWAPGGAEVWAHPLGPIIYLGAQEERCDRCRGDVGDSEGTHEDTGKPICAGCYLALSALGHCANLTRTEAVTLLLDAGIQCYADETIETLREAVSCNVKDGTIDPTLVLNLE